MNQVWTAENFNAVKAAHDRWRNDVHFGRPEASQSRETYNKAVEKANFDFEALAVATKLHDLTPEQQAHALASVAADREAHPDPFEGLA